MDLKNSQSPASSPPSERESDDFSEERVILEMERLFSALQWALTIDQGEGFCLPKWQDVVRHAVDTHIAWRAKCDHTKIYFRSNVGTCTQCGVTFHPIPAEGKP